MCNFAASFVGLVAEGLGAGLQNRLQRFESARDLNHNLLYYLQWVFLFMARIVLVGFPGSGKSTIGKKIASKLHYDFYDLDEVFEHNYHISIENFFEKYDENAFRICERILMSELLRKENCVISTGGGTPCFFDTMDNIIESSISVYIKLSHKSLVYRLLNSHKVRPLIKNKSEEELMRFVEEQMSQREGYYLRSHFIFNGESIDIVQVINTLKEHCSL